MANIHHLNLSLYFRLRAIKQSHVKDWWDKIAVGIGESEIIFILKIQTFDYFYLLYKYFQITNYIPSLQIELS